MDLRVLAAVFLTLFAVAIGMSQGALDIQEVRGSLDDLRTSGDISDLLKRAGSTASNTTISGSITAAGDTELEIRSGSRLELDIRPSTTATVGDSALQTSGNTSLVVRGFRGTIHVSPDNMTVKGTTEGITTPSFDFSYSSPKKLKVGSPSPMINIMDLKKQTFDFKNATGTVTAEGTSVEVDGEQALFRGFTGNMTVEGNSYSLEGRLQSAALGDAEIG